MMTAQLDTKLKQAKARIIKASTPHSGIRESEWRVHYENDVSYLVQKIEELCAELPQDQDEKPKRKK